MTTYRVRVDDDETLGYYFIHVEAESLPEAAEIAVRQVLGPRAKPRWTWLDAGAHGQGVEGWWHLKRLRVAAEIEHAAALITERETQETT